jgi:plasmid maintenance system antidote protein VapI
MASDLTKEEQEHVRAALRFLAVRFGTMGMMAKALHFQVDTLRHAMDGKESVSPTMAFRLARLAAVGVDDLLAGRYPVPGTCPHCGRGPY